jgi:hypothetical protein
MAMALTPAASGGLITITSEQQQSGFVGYIPAPLYSSDVFAPPITGQAFNFSGTDYASLRTIESISLRLTIANGGTGIGEDDYNQHSLWLNGIETGIKLNGFPDGQWKTGEVSGAPANGSTILNQLRATGTLSAALYDNCCASGESREYTVVGIPSFDYSGFFNEIIAQATDPAHPLTDPANLSAFGEKIKALTGATLTTEQLQQLVVNLPTSDSALAGALNLEGAPIYATLTITGSDAPEPATGLLITGGLLAAIAGGLRRGTQKAASGSSIGRNTA